VRCGIAWDPGSPALSDARIAIDGARFASVAAASETSPPEHEIDYRPFFCMPGLVDAHTHLTSYAGEHPGDSLERRRAEAVRAALATLRAGVTSVRDLGGSEGVDVWLRDEIARGDVLGPRMQAAGTQIGLGGPLGGPEAARESVFRHVRAGSDVIKLFATGGANEPVLLMPESEMAAATSEAHAHGMRVAVHAITTAGIERALGAGVDSIEHAGELTVDQARAMASLGVVLVPTLYILRYYIEEGQRLMFSEAEVADLKRVVRTLVVPFERRLPAILATGVNVAMGSDAFMGLHGRNARELVFMARAGMGTEDVLRAATATSAALLNWQGSVGTLRPGAYADLLVLRDDPRVDMEAIEHVVAVLRGGVPVPLDAPPP
jgi:imidazolonepropionase-like amidohydrolase